jgi:uncharacterized protein DUF1580
MIDPFDGEDLLTASEVAKLLPGRPHACTIWRWMTRGVRGHKLESLFLSGARRTTKSAVCFFLAQVTADADGHAPAPAPTAAQRLQQIEQAERELDDAGI